MNVGAAGVKITGTTPLLTIGDAGAEDTTILFDGNAQDYYIALDDSADDLLIGLGSAVGTTPVVAMDENLKSTFYGDVTIGGTTPVLTIGDAGAEDTAIVFDGNAKDFYVALDDSADKLVIGEGSTVGTNSILTITDDTVTLGDGAAVDTALVYDGNAKDFYVGLDDSADKLVIGEGSTVGTNSILTLTDDTVTLGDGAAVDCNLILSGNAANWSVGIDDSDDLLELRGGTTPASNVAVAFNSSGEIKKLTAAAGAVDVANDQLMFYDGGPTGVPIVDSIADLATAMAGAGITATNGVFSTDASSTPNEITIGATCTEGFNYINSTLTGAFAAYLPASPTVGDIVYVKARDGVTTTNSVTIHRTTGTHTIDGTDSLVIESPYGAFSLSYVANNDWRVF
jgi:hypothetical protein